MRTALFGSAVGAFMHSFYRGGAHSSALEDTSSCHGGPRHDAFDTTQKIVPHPPAIDPKEFRSFPLVNVYDETPDTKVLRFAFPDGMMEAGMKLCSIVLLKYTDPRDGKDVVRPYTPISRLDQRGYMEIMVKAYKDSKMGSHLHRMKLGEKVDIKGPFEKLNYVPGQYKKLGMLAGGTGITPMFQVCREVLKTKDSPEISLLFANKRKDDILLGSELTELYELHQNFAAHFVLESPPKDWMGGVGFVTPEMVKAFMPPPSRAYDSLIMVCGPPGFMKHISGDKDFSKSPPTQGELTGILRDLGYPQKMVYKF